MPFLKYGAPQILWSLIPVLLVDSPFLQIEFQHTARAYLGEVPVITRVGAEIERALINTPNHQYPQIINSVLKVTERTTGF